MSYTVYIIYSPILDKYYIGYTENVLLRLEQHNSGISTFTAKASDWQLKYSEVFPTRETAMRREKEIKNKKAGNTLSGLYVGQLYRERGANRQTSVFGDSLPNCAIPE